jgi:hypothetical protein
MFENYHDTNKAKDYFNLNLRLKYFLNLFDNEVNIKKIHLLKFAFKQGDLHA